jgi:hypothetical protein
MDLAWFTIDYSRAIAMQALSVAVLDKCLDLVKSNSQAIVKILSQGPSGPAPLPEGLGAAVDITA